MQQFNPQFSRDPRRERRDSSSTEKTSLAIPIAIIAAGLLIAGSLIYVKLHTSPTNILKPSTTAHPEENMAPVTGADHILGSPNATVVIVEYSDTECPFCQQYQKTLQRIVDEFGKKGQVAWVYRHFAFHPKAPVEAEATECAAELGGNDKFWQYTDLLFSKKDFTQSPYIGLDSSTLPTLAGSIGLDQKAFSECLASGRYKQKVAASYDEAVKAGAQGTPYTVLVTKNGKIPIYSGAISYETLRAAIATLLNQTPQ
jgi:protein-disulfide isomerase